MLGDGRCNGNNSTDSYAPGLLQTSINIQKGHTKVNVDLVWDFDVENIHVEAWINQSSIWTIIMLTRYLDEQKDGDWIKLPRTKSWRGNKYPVQWPLWQWPTSLGQGLLVTLWGLSGTIYMLDTKWLSLCNKRNNIKCLVNCTMVLWPTSQGHSLIGLIREVLETV